MVKGNRDTIYYWMQKAADAKWWIDGYEASYTTLTFPHYAEKQSEYDYAMEQIRWMRRLDTFERSTDPPADSA